MISLNRYFLLLWLTTVGLALAEDGQVLSQLVAHPIRSLDLSDESNMRMDFAYQDSNAWVLGNGDWYIQGRIKHRGILCGKYRLGIQFGVGNPGCLNVNWIGKADFGKTQTQCNNSTMHYVGGGSSELAKKFFTTLTCSRRIIFCEGDC